MLRVEFIGLPGAGKTTLRKGLLDRLHRVDHERYLSAEEAFLQVSKLHIDNIFRRILNFLPNSIALKFSNKLINRSLMQFHGQSRFLALKGKALEAYLTSNAYKNMSLNDRAIVTASFLETGSLWDCINRWMPDQSVVFFEEGFVQKSFMFVDHSNDAIIETENLHAYLANIPLPDLIIYVKADIETCYKRMKTRADGMTERLKTADEQKINKFLTISHNHLECVTAWLNNKCTKKIIEIKNDDSNEIDYLNIIKKISNLKT